MLEPTLSYLSARLRYAWWKPQDGTTELAGMISARTNAGTIAGMAS